jgi:DNA polymerase elongation subunit (family B)
MTLVFDIETDVVGAKPNPLKDKFRFMGAYEVEAKIYHFVETKEEVINLLKKHKVIIGYNSKEYDEPILKRHGMFPYRHLHIDLFEVIKKRAEVLGCKNESKSMRNMAKFFDLKQVKSELDYNLLKKYNLLKHEYEEIKAYTLVDIRITYELFQKLCEFFEPFKGFMSNYDKSNYKWLTSSISVYSYKVICNAVGLKERYNDNVEHKGYKGGFVAEPIKAEEHDDIYCFDFNSLYPHNMIQGNLFSHSCKCCREDEKWKGNNLFPLVGGYCSKRLGDIERKIHKIYCMRKELKKNNDKREYALKIVINTLYGLTGNPVFESLYNYKAAHDCTLIGRESIKLARKKFIDSGYYVLYSDTDSVYLKDVFKDKDRLLMVKESIIKEIKNNLPFPIITFDMGIDEEIKHIWFFKKNDKFLKKHYMFVTNKGKLKVKGLPMIKNDSSKIGYKIFNKYMNERVIKGDIKFTYEEIKNWLYNELTEDILIAARKFNVNEFDYYKNPNQLQAQISKEHGTGVHILLPNKYLGVGKSVRYCTVEEFKKRGLSLNCLVLNKFWSEMDCFSNYVPKAFSTKKDNSQIELSAWTIQ